MSNDTSNDTSYEPGWYETQPGYERYWDGSTWTTKLRPIDISEDPMAPFRDTEEYLEPSNTIQTKHTYQPNTNKTETPTSPVSLGYSSGYQQGTRSSFITEPKSIGYHGGNPSKMKNMQSIVPFASILIVGVLVFSFLGYLLTSS